MVKKIAIGVGTIIILLIAYNLLVQIIDAVKSQERLSKQAEIVSKLEIKNKQLQSKLYEIQSPEFIEEEARNKLGLGRAGETLVIIPEEKLKSVIGASSSASEVRFPNWLGWLKVFFR